MPKLSKLPAFIPPMLATPAAPFDSDDFLFEIKWDGIRCLAFIEDGGYRLSNRRRADMTERYPEFGFLKDLPSGTVLDGEMIVLKNGKPDFPALMSREQARTPMRIRNAARVMPAIYIAFDMLYEQGQPILDLPLRERRERLAQLVRRTNNPRLQLSEAIPAKGTAFFAEAVKQNLEGVVAKRALSRYQPGQRNDSWLKIKRQSEVLCAVIGFVPDGPKDFRSLIIACAQEGELRCVGKVGSGIQDSLRKPLNQLLWNRLLRKPLVPCTIKGKWIKPGLFCKVAFQELTENGDFRSPVFKELIVRDDVKEEPPSPADTSREKQDFNPQGERI